MLISVSTGWRPICLPTILGSMMLRITVMIRYSTSKERPRVSSPPSRDRIAQGIMMPPVPSTGRMSNTAISAAIRVDRSTPMTHSPMESSVKVMNMIRA